MNPNSSPTWRRQGDAVAFDHGAWEFQARQVHASAHVLLDFSNQSVAAQSWEGVMVLPTAQYLFALSLELMGKALFLKKNLGAREKIYTHAVSSLIASSFLDNHQTQLLQYAEELVMWAGRYPTPKWTTEISKQKFDVPSVVVNGMEHIDASSLPNSASPQRCQDFIKLFEVLQSAWTAP